MLCFHEDFSGIRIRAATKIPHTVSQESYALNMDSYIAVHALIRQLMWSYTEFRLPSRANWQRENSREFENFWKGLRTMLYSLNEEVYLSKLMHISNLRKVLVCVLYNNHNFINEFAKNLRLNLWVIFARKHFVFDRAWQISSSLLVCGPFFLIIVIYPKFNDHLN